MIKDRPMRQYLYDILLVGCRGSTKLRIDGVRCRDVRRARHTLRGVGRFPAINIESEVDGVDIVVNSENVKVVAGSQ